MNIFLAVLSLPPLRSPHIFLPQRFQAYRFLTPLPPHSLSRAKASGPRILWGLVRNTDCWPHPGVSDLLDGFPNVSSGEKSSCLCRRLMFDPLVEKIPWRRKWQPTPVFLLGKSHGQRSLVGYSPLVAKSWTQLRTHSQGCEWQVPVWVVLVGGGHGWWALLGGKRPHPLTQSQTLRRPTGQK